MRINVTLLAMLCLLSTQAQILSSGFEAWSGVVPLGWLGEQTTIAIDSVEQVSTDVHGGDHAVRLRHATNGYARFTTQILHVDSGTTYTVSYWARGQGHISAMLYDANLIVEFSPQSILFDTISSNTWELHTRNIQCRNTTDVGEFAFFVRKTVGPEHLVVDDVSVDLFVLVPPAFHTIQEIQTLTGGGDESPLRDSVVATTGIVTGISRPQLGSQYFLQNGTGPYSGICVVASTTGLTLGDEVTVYGTVREFGNGVSTNTRMESVYARFIESTGNPDPDPMVLTTAAMEQEQWESVLIHVDNLVCAGINAEGWMAMTDSYLGQVGDLFYVPDVTLGATYGVTGVERFMGWTSWSLEPRSEADVLEVVGIEERAFGSLRVHPNPASDVLHIALAPAQNGARYTITDVTGRSVMTDRLTSGPLHVGRLLNGLYTLTIWNDVDVRQTRFEVLH